jgi:hypothetical protein
MQGYRLLWRGRNCVSVTTHGSSGSQQDMLLAAPGANSHSHLWVEVPSNLSTAGQRLTSHGDHVTSSSSLPSQGPFARARLGFDQAGGSIGVTLATIDEGSTTTAGRGHGKTPGKTPRAPIDLGMSDHASIRWSSRFLVLIKHTLGLVGQS